MLSGQQFRITKPLGQGSFGIVWAAEDENGISVAIKEIPCRSESELTRISAEGRLLQMVEDELVSAGLTNAAQHVPVLVASEVEQASTTKWRVRLAMSLLKGKPLENFLESQQQRLKAQVHVHEQPCHQFAEACRCAGHLLVQLAPILEAFSNKVYHRDITPRNILIQETNDGGDPIFGLVDFGLAVEASKWRAGEPGAGDLGGDGRYWPASAWYCFCYGTRALEREAWLRSEYRQCLDVHSLGITALRCLVEMLPLHLSEGVTHNTKYSAALQSLQKLRSVWKRYWLDARRLWQPVFDAFRSNGDFDSLRAMYISAGVHNVISDDLCALRLALREAQAACENLPAESGLAGMPALFDGLLLMIQAGRADMEPASLPVEVPAHSLPVEDPAHVRKARLQRWSSMSTESPESTPPSSDSSPSSSSSQGSSEFGSLTSALPTPAARYSAWEGDIAQVRRKEAARS